MAGARWGRASPVTASCASGENSIGRVYDGGPGTSVYAPAMDDAVVVKVVSGESEAEVVCGLLRSAGIECGYRDTDAVDSAFEDFIASGPREILVHQSDLEAARALVGEATG